MNSFPNHLKRLRKSRGMTQDLLAQQLHVTRQTVSGWETGRCQPDIETLTALAGALEADIAELIYGVKPGDYPRCQTRYVITASACGGIALAALLFCLFFMPWIKLYCSNNYLPWHWYLYNTVPQIGWFAAGMLLPAALAMVHRIALSPRGILLCRIGGIAAGLPGGLIGADILLTAAFSGYPQIFTMLFYPWNAVLQGRVILLMAMPFAAGMLLFLGWNKNP